MSLAKPSKYGFDPNRQDSAFFTDGDSQVVWSSTETPYYVVCCGEMRVLYKDEILRSTDELDKAGITTDKILEDLMRKEEIIFYNNSWFEVYNNDDLDYYSEPLGTIDEAVDYVADRVLEDTGKPLNIVVQSFGEEPDIIY